MTTDEVVLRRAKAAANGKPYKTPPPRLRGQSTYLALLSSLATDLDIMLNDLRSSPSTRLLPNSHHLPTRSASNGSSPLTIGGTNASNNSNNNENVNYFGYRRRALCSNYNVQQQSTRVHATTTTATTTTVKTTQCYRRGQNSNQATTSAKSGTAATPTATASNATDIATTGNLSSKQKLIQQSSNKSISSNRLTQQQLTNKTQTPNQQRQQVNRNRPDVQKLRARNANNSATTKSVGNGESNGNVTKNLSNRIPTSAKCNSKSYGLSPEVKQIQKLPLWSYQQRQLEQPQKVHIQRLQQRQPQRQRATQSIIVGKTTDVTTTDVKVNRCKSVTKNVGSKNCVGSVVRSEATPKIATAELQKEKDQANKRNCDSNTEYSDCKEDTLRWLNMTTDFFGLGPDTDTIWSSEHSSSHQTSNSNVTLTSQNQSKTTSNIVTQHCNTTTTASTIVSSSISSNNNSNNNNHRRLPFCGLDSIKGSDKNGIGSSGVKSAGTGGGTTNLSFDLNLQSEKHGNTGQGLKSANVDLASEQFHSLDAPDSSIDGQFEDDMQALLPKCQRLSRDELSQSRTSLVSSSDGGILAEGETSSETSRGSDDSPPCDLGLVERLLLTHPVWFLPGIQRSGAVHFLQGKEEGNFIVRGSSQPNTMAVSVRLPPDTGPYIEHYLIQSNDGILSLESSRFKFDSIPALIAHYAQCCDELPVQLILPRALREAKNRQQLSSLALLGQEFWRYPMSCPKSSELESTNFLDPKSPNSLTETSGLGTTVFSSNAVAAPQSGKIFSPTSILRDVAASINNGIFSQAGTPSDTTSSMSSFTTSGGQHMQVMSPESVDSVILTMSPVDMNNQRNGIVGLQGSASTESSSLSTFKAANGLTPAPFKAPSKQNIENGIRPQRPKPPNTLNLDLRKPPAPPLRWSKPISPHSPTEPAANNFTVTTTVTFSMDQNQNSTPQFVEVTTPAANNNILTPAINANTTTFQTFSKRLSPEGECKDTLSSQGSSSTGSRWQSQSSKDSNNSQRKILSPNSMASTPTSAISGHVHHSAKLRKSKARKESKHYQESDILESPQIYCRSTLIDKISDYEDLWSHDPSERAGLLTSFKPAAQPPDGLQGKRPDLLAETPTITSLNANLLSPANSNYDSSSPPHAIQEQVITATATAATPTAENTTDTHELIQFSGESQPRSRTGLLLPGIMSQSLSENQLKHISSTGGETTEGDDTTPTALTPASRSKQGSPFYAEPADALRQAGLATASILRRSQRGPLFPANHRHSEPPKGGIARTPMCPLLVPAEIEKIAGSLDELKKKQQLQLQQKAQPQQQQASKRARGRFEQWQLDSSWEFMGKQDNDRNDNDAADDADADYDSEAHWKSAKQTSQDKENILQNDQTQQQGEQQIQKPKAVTVHQIIAKRLPDLNLPELVRCSTPPQQTQPQNTANKLSNNSDSHSVLPNPKFVDTCSRLSSYDNVERNYSFCQSYFNGIDSAQSDDGTVFSEPWDSSQWDSFMPHDDATITSDTIHLSKCRPAVSEDDTIVEELSTKDHSQDTLKARKTNGRQKVATILRNPSMRDREVLCHPRNKINPYSNYSGPGDSVREYTLQLAQDQCSTFARNIENFISCTKESREAAPQVVMRNMRQFMNGMKNYLVKHGEGKFQQEVDAARGRLKSDEFLNLDAILETVMHQLVVLPLREHLYGMFVDYYTRSEDIQLLAQNVKYACGRNASDFGIRSSVTPPSPTSLTVISNLLLRLQEAELPLDKMDLFLCVISTIFDATGCQRGQQLGADDFLPILVYVVAKCGFVGAEIEAEFMWGLLQPTLLNGEPGYYLTALCSAVHVLKSFMASENESGSGSLDWRSSSLPACSSVLRVIIPDECNGSLQTRTLPVRPHTTTREVCRIIAHKARITNPQDYALFKLVDGEETLLNDVECPQDIRLAAKGKHCMLAYKRIDAKIAWPTATQPMHN